VEYLVDYLVCCLFKLTVVNSGSTKFLFKIEFLVTYFVIGSIGFEYLR